MTAPLPLLSLPAAPTSPVGLALAKRRSARRARQGGAVVFIVSMTIGVLVSLGAFALISASTEIKSAGYERQALQTHYLSEYAMVAAAQKLDGNYARLIVGQMAVTGGGGVVGDYDPGFPRKHCISLEAVPSTASTASRGCKIMRMNDLSQGWAGISAPLRPSTIATPGSLGPVALDGNFSVEITDVAFGTTAAGYAVGGQAQQISGCPVSFTVTTFGQVLPNYAGSNTAQLFGAASLEEGRGRLTGGPLSPCPM